MGRERFLFVPFPLPCGSALWDPDLSGWKSWRYSPECVEVEFSEVGGSKQPIRRSGKSSITTWWHPFSVKTLRFGSSSCTVLYQGVATRNSATTGEIRADLRRSDRGSWRQSQTASPPPQVLVR